MDLPTTDPGSDLCDLTDSADEGFIRSEEKEYEGIYLHKCLIIIEININVCICMHAGFTVGWKGIREHHEEIIELPEQETIEKEKRQKKLILPEIVRPRSVSFGELLPRKDHRKTRQRPRCLRYN